MVGRQSGSKASLSVEHDRFQRIEFSPNTLYMVLTTESNLFTHSDRGRELKRFLDSWEVFESIEVLLESVKKLTIFEDLA